MHQDKLWNTFAATGRVEDYLRYRGITPSDATNSVKEGSGYGHRPQTASDDRRSDPPGV